MKGLVAVAMLAWSTPAMGQEVWAGHQVVFGQREVPFAGQMEFRTDSYVLARVTRFGRYLEIEQIPCRVQFPTAMGVEIGMKPSTLQALPRATMRFEVSPSNTAKSESWFVGWGGEDLDADGKPGVTVTVNAPLCGGELYVANGATSTANARITEDGMVGDIWVHVQQEVLDASNVCLSWFSPDTDEKQRGTFAYRRLDEATTCDSLLTRETWPVKAPSRPSHEP